MELNQWNEEQDAPHDSDLKKQKMGFGAGMGFGVLAGILLSVMFCVIFVMVYTSTLGKYLVLGKHGVAAEAKSDLLNGATVDKVNELALYMDLYYYEDFKEEDIRNGLVSGVMKGLEDPYSVYYTPQDYADLQVTTTGTYYGIGAGLKQDPDTMVVTISKVYAGTPSEEAGLKKDDIIMYVDETEATSMELSDLVQLIRGKEGTQVHLQIYRSSTEETLEFDVERKNVELPSVEGQMLEHNMGYIQISEFQKNTATQFSKILSELQGKGMEGLIVDVRSNPGGLLTSVVDILDELLPKGVVVYTQDKYGVRQDYESKPSCVDFPIVVLVDENSASASEIFAGAIKDFDYGTIVGKKTFGKGIVQTIFPLEDGDALKITTAKYFTPEGNYIHGVGISPDVELEYKYEGPKDKDYEMKYDNQLNKAIEVLGEKMAK